MKYPVLSPIRRNGRLIKPGKGVTVEIPEKDQADADALIAIGAIADPRTEAEAEGADEKAGGKKPAAKRQQAGKEGAGGKG